MNALSPAKIELDAELQRQKFAASLAQLRSQLKPASLAEEASEQLKAVASHTLDVATEKAKTPAGIGTVAAGLAISAVAFGLRRKFAQASPPEPQQEVYGLSPPARKLSQSSVFGAAATFGASLLLGAAASKLIAPSRPEQELLKGVGAEIKAAGEEWARREISQLVSPGPGKSFGAVNAMAIGLGLLLGAGRRSE